MNPFEKRFLNLIKESDVDELLQTLEVDDDMAEKDAMKSTLDKGVTPHDFEAAENEASNISRRNQEYMVNTLNEWIKRIDDFIKFLNDTDNSVQTILHKAPPDTLFNKISIAETKKISRVAMELSSLNEMLKGYLVSANDPHLRYV